MIHHQKFIKKRLTLHGEMQIVEIDNDINTKCYYMIQKRQHFPEPLIFQVAKLPQFICKIKQLSNTVKRYWRYHNSLD